MNKFVATAIALCLGAASLAVQAQTGGKKQFDPYSQGAKSGEKFDPYSQGANKSTRSDLTDASAPAAEQKPAKKSTKKKSKKKAASAPAAS
ncbi:conserved exported hypothetical protein [Cupriavidus necator]|uniref:Amino acid ABC transporter permease n=1 Tax=Cupriavidus necator TaxID=106590 RepID=A0A1K0IPT5_CUPNE|nr:conserved exported hypothetical protein [Cupriavidus necator]